MAQIVNPTNLQKSEFDVTTAEGPSHVTIVTGILQVFLGVQTQGPQQQTQNDSFEALLDPQLGPGQFRKAVATASIANFSLFAQDPTAATGSRWSIDQVEATLDDESGRIQLRIDASVFASGNNTSVQINGFTFQVTTLSRPAAA